MQLGMIGLGRMGANIVRRLVKDGHECVVYDHNRDAVSAMAGEDNTTGASSLAELAEALPAPRVVWVMVPAGDITTGVIEQLADALDKGDIVIDGGNSYYRDDIRHAKALSGKGIRLLDCGTSGGVWGRERGYCLMIGGDADAVTHAEPIFASVAPGVDAAARTPGREGPIAQSEKGYLHCGPSGAGHFVKMVHNGIEYGIMEAYAEGFSIMRAKSPLHLDLEQISQIWRYGSVVRSWLLDLTADALRKNPTLEGLEAYVPDSGEGRWTVFEAIDLNVSAPVITESLIRRLRSREENNFTDRMLSVMRNEFGGHAVKKN
ncbi:MAG: phosphogluconate dehydrogenase (NAD(+)-dependent, decarboxylating) [Mycobacterium sp.]